MMILYELSSFKQAYEYVMKISKSEDIDFYKELVKEMTRIIKKKYNENVRKEDISFEVANMFDSKNFDDLTNKVNDMVAFNKEENEKDLYTVYVQYWDESESGWGTRSDGISVHKNIEDVKSYVSSEMKRQEDMNSGSGTPDCYFINIGNPVIKFVKKEEYQKILEKGYIRTYKSKPDWLYDNF